MLSKNCEIILKRNKNIAKLQKDAYKKAQNYIKGEQRERNYIKREKMREK